MLCAVRPSVSSWASVRNTAIDCAVGTPPSRGVKAVSRKSSGADLPMIDQDFDEEWNNAIVGDAHEVPHDTQLPAV